MTASLTDSEFSETSWHDVHVHGYAVVPDKFELLFDVDYISEWLCAGKGQPASFRLSPATLRFQNCLHVEFAMKSEQGLFSILEMQRTDWFQHPAAKVGTWLWKLVCDAGRIEFRASGYQLYIRADPILSAEQYLTSEARGQPIFCC